MMKKLILILTVALLASCSEEKKSEIKVRPGDSQETKENKATASPEASKMETKATQSAVPSGKPAAKTAAKNELTVKKGETVDLKQGNLIDKKFKSSSLWSSSNNKIAKVDKSGRVTALKEGNVTITAIDPQDKTKKSAVKITVSGGSAEKKAASSETADMVVMETSMGTIKLRLFPNEAPKTVENFTKLADKGYYDKLIFHRVIDGFMIQGGDPQGTGVGGESIWGKPFEDEFNEKLKFDRKGILAMANAGPNTNGSQFFITVAPTPHLNMHHTIFGEVTEGMDVVEAISKVPRDPNDKPLAPVVMKKVRTADKM
jgi:cyclophilin family peptidyl-prolyl cis-trans isomerase